MVPASTGTRACAILTALALLLPSPGPAQAIDPEFRADILRLMEITGALDLGEQMGNAAADQMIAMLEATQPGTPPRVFEIVREVTAEFMAEAFHGPDGMLEELLAVHARHLSHADVRAMLEFYETPAGRRLASTLPAITQESMAVGEAWGERIGSKLDAALTERFRAEGFLP